MCLSAPSDLHRYSPDDSGDFQAPAETHWGKRQDGVETPMRKQSAPCQWHVTRASSAQCHVSIWLSVSLVCLIWSDGWLELKVRTTAPRLFTQTHRSVRAVCLVLDLFPTSSQCRVWIFIYFLYLTLWSLEPLKNFRLIFFFSSWFWLYVEDPPPSPLLFVYPQTCA